MVICQDGDTKADAGKLRKDYGFITDYFCEIMHELRRADPMSTVRSRFNLVDTAGTVRGVSVVISVL